ncbi:MAG: TetR family transcriptional regulator C-terminal domain-containing protein [Pseudomonadota bacterium]
MATKGEKTREAILKIAESMILKNGYSGTSIDQVIAESTITKGGFFYHFDGKNDLAKHLVIRYLEQDALFFEGLMNRAYELSDDPLQQMLLFVKLMAEQMAELPETHPGCLVASLTYESNRLNDDVRTLIAEGILSWRKLFRTQLEKVVAVNPPTIDVSVDELADMLTAVIEGGILLSRSLEDKSRLPHQLQNYHSFLRLLFSTR